VIESHAGPFREIGTLGHCDRTQAATKPRSQVAREGWSNFLDIAALGCILSFCSIPPRCQRHQCDHHDGSQVGAK
jgi:hypothetical protein